MLGASSAGIVDMDTRDEITAADKAMSHLQIVR
jgi:hypothetical protein